MLKEALDITRAQEVADSQVCKIESGKRSSEASREVNKLMKSCQPGK